MAGFSSTLVAFARELRRRRVFRVALVYGVVGWALIQVSATVTEPLRLPAWTPTLVILLVALGFPLALVLAWLFDVTPEGLRRAAAAGVAAATPAVSGPTAGPRGPLAAGLGVGVVVAAIGLAAYATFGGADAGASDAPGRSIVVLPFDNMSDEQGSAHFADGVTEEITAALAGIGDLAVTSRTSAMRYRGSELSIPEIGRELGVDVVLEGSVRRAGTQVRITAQLIDARTDEHVWAESWDRELTADAFFAVQSDIAQSIATELRATLSADERDAIERRPTTNLAAYELYLQATLPVEEGSDLGESIRLRSGMLRRTLELDPAFALAEVRLAELMAISATAYAEPVWLDSARSHVAHALATDPTLPEAWLLDGRLADAGGDPDAADRAIRRAIELRPSFAEALSRLGELEADRGRFAEAVELLHSAWRLEPTQPQHAFELGAALIEVGAVDLADAWLGRVVQHGRFIGREFTSRFVELELMRGDTAAAVERMGVLLTPAARASSEDLPAYWELLGDLSLQLGRHDSAAAYYQRQRGLLRDDPNATFTGLALILKQRGQDAEAARLLDDAERVAQRMVEASPVDGYHRLAMVEAVRGNRDLAVAHLEHALAEGYTISATLTINPRFRLLEGHARYDALMRELARARARARVRIEALELSS